MKLQKNVQWSHRYQGSSLKVLYGFIHVLVLLESYECKDEFLCLRLLQHLQVNTPLLLLIVNQHLESQDKRRLNKREGGDSTVLAGIALDLVSVPGDEESATLDYIP